MGLDVLSRLPKASEKRIAVRISPQAERHLRDGHPWLFDRAITSISHEGAPGDIAVVFDRKKRFLAAGLYDPQSPIRVRLFVHQSPEVIGQGLFIRRIRDALAIRDPLRRSRTTNGYRLVHGANDRLPGVVVDRYGQLLVVKLYSAAWVPHLNSFLEALTALTFPKHIILRLSRRLQTQQGALAGLQDGQTLLGVPSSESIPFVENGLHFEADVVRGQKTGFFLDQRENRLRVWELAGSRRMLNVFSYSGGFSLYAARGGARQLTDIDQSAQALKAAQHHFSLNAQDPFISAAEHRVIRGDAFAVLASLASSGDTFDMVVLDPPAFARRSSAVSAALNAYRRLVRLGLSVLEPGGTLVASSCSSHVAAEEFYESVLFAVDEATRSLTEIVRTGHPLDHPIGFREGAYLKTMFAQVD